MQSKNKKMFYWRFACKLPASIVALGGIVVALLLIGSPLRLHAQPAATSTVYLPVVFNDHANIAYRVGYGVTASPITRYGQIRELMAGWYTDWWVTPNPVRPAGIEFAQTVRLHQKLACGQRYHHDRTACPYAQPLDYVLWTDKASIEAAAKAQPGSVWFIGNEMERIDWKVCEQVDANNNCTRFGSGGQDEILPATYARAYNDVYNMIKAIDPTARVAIGGVIQATPLRLQWLTLVWDEYKKLYNKDMQVDIWNVHNFVISERRGGFGAEIPAGLPSNTPDGSYLGDPAAHVNKTYFDQQIRAFRQFMKDRGQQQKQLVISEYGVLTSDCIKVENGVCTVDLKTPQVVHDFMTWTFDYYMNTKDCNLGPTNDDCRLVQRWLWFSLDHTGTAPNGAISAGANMHASLFDHGNLQTRPAGVRFRQYVGDNLAALSTKPK